MMCNNIIKRAINEKKVSIIIKIPEISFYSKKYSQEECKTFIQNKLIQIGYCILMIDDGIFVSWEHIVQKYENT